MGPVIDQFYTNPLIAVPVAAFVLAAIVFLLARRSTMRKRRKSGCEKALASIERMQAAIKSGVLFAGYGAFSSAGREARLEVENVRGWVVDRRLRILLDEVVAAYDEAKNAALPAEPFNPKWQETAFLRGAALGLDPSSPHHRLEAKVAESFARIQLLERNAAGQ